MISGVVDVELADYLSPYTLQLVNILRSDIISLQHDDILLAHLVLRKKMLVISNTGHDPGFTFRIFFFKTQDG